MAIKLLKMKYLNEAIKSIAFKYTKLGAPIYPYNVEPIQLSFLINEIERLRDFTGNIVEIGVARGMTTRFIVEHIVNQNLDQTVKFFAIDTFTSFTKEDLAYEVNNRGKILRDLKGFDYNDYDIWSKNFNEFSFVEAIKADCSEFDYSTLKPIKLVFLDVDLYLPTKKALTKIYTNLIEGGTILIDDVRPNATYDGAYQAYIEFCEEIMRVPQIIGNKCGVIRK